MKKTRFLKRLITVSLSATMVFAIGISGYANGKGLPNGSITIENNTRYLTDSRGQKYSGWFVDENKDWFYFNESDKSMKTGWHYDDKDGYTYYLEPSNGKMLTGWQSVDGKEYFFQPVRDRGNYNFSSEQERWLYSKNSNVPYGAMYVSTTTPDGSNVDSTGAKTLTNNQSSANSSGTNTADEKDGWVSDNGKWFYYENGGAVTNTWKDIDGNSYYFGADGAMYVNATTPDGSTVDNSGAKVLTTEYDYSDYIGIFNDGYDEESGRFTHSTGMEEFNITQIENNKIYGEYYHSSYSYDLESTIDGIVIEDNQFSITIKKIEHIVLNGEYKPSESYYSATFELGKKNGQPVIIPRHGNSSMIFYKKN